MNMAHPTPRWSFPIRSLLVLRFVRAGTLLVVALLLGPGAMPAARAELQFDVFLGFDSQVREAGWFPIAIEAFNDGPPLDAVIEVSSGGLGADQVRQVPIELPTNTKKRLTIPIFATGSRFNPQQDWLVRLVDRKGRLIVERGAQSRQLPAETRLIGALSRALAGTPVLPETGPAVVARLQPDVFPDNPLTLESMDALYLNSERALNLQINQIAAILAWLRHGGHLILAVEQVNDVNATPWLRELLPCDLSETASLGIAAPLRAWIESNRPDPVPLPDGPRRGARRAASPSVMNPGPSWEEDASLNEARVPVAQTRLHPPAVSLLQVEDRALVLRAHEGRGTITVLTFSPEREPFRSWKGRPWFWAGLLDHNPAAMPGQPAMNYGGASIDGVFGGLLDSRQVRKLPVPWLLLLLVVYLVVIGPLDRWWLKKINRPMLTWVTFPGYVVFFSLLIYYIGYRLRAGETEWNELHLVDVLERGGRVELRGHTYIGLYSSEPATYPVASDQPFATFRPELIDLLGGPRGDKRAEIVQTGNSYAGRLTVPVWTSLLYESDWLQGASAPPARASVAPTGNGGFALTAENRLDRPLTHLRLAAGGMMFELGTLEAGEKKSFTLQPAEGVSLREFTQLHAIQNNKTFVSVTEARRSAVGGTSAGQLEDPARVSTVASFPSLIPTHHLNRPFVAPPRLDLGPLVERGDAVLFAYDAGHAPIKPIHQFKPVRQSRNTLFRLAIPMTR